MQYNIELLPYCMFCVRGTIGAMQFFRAQQKMPQLIVKDWPIVRANKTQNEFSIKHLHGKTTYCSFRYSRLAGKR